MSSLTPICAGGQEAAVLTPSNVAHLTQALPCNFAVSGTGGGVQYIAYGELDVTPVADLTLTLNQPGGPPSIAPPSSGTVQANYPITVTSQNGYSGTINFTAAFTGSVVPQGVSFYAITPVSTSSGGSGYTTVTANVPPGVAAGPYTLTITGTDSTGVPHSLYGTLNIQTGADYTLSVSPAQNIQQGQPANYQISMAPAGTGFNGTVTLNMGAITGGVTGSLSTTVISAGSPATLTLSAQNNATLGTYPILVNGIATSGTITHSVLAVLGVAMSTSPGGTATAGGTVTVGTVAVPPGVPAGITVSSPVLLGPNQAVCSMSQGSAGITAMPNVLGQTITFTATSSAVPATATCATGAPEPAPQYVQVPCIPEDLIDLSVTSDGPGIWDFDVSSDDPDVFVTSMLVSIQTRTPSGQYTPYSLSAPPNGDNDFTVYWAPGAPCGIYNVAMAYFDDDYDDGPIFANASAYLCYEGPPPCTPSVSSIQVNASQTNTLILGTTGTLVINGTCLENATGVGAAGAGVNVGTITQNTNDLVTAVYQSTSLGSPTLGNETVTLQTANGASYGQIFAAVLTVQAVSFSGNVAYQKDCPGRAVTVPITLPNGSTAPSWQASNATANNCPAALAGDATPQNEAVVYVAGSTISGSAQFSVSPMLPQALPGVRVEGQVSALGLLVANVAIPSGASSFAAPFTANTALPATTQYFAPMVVNWNISANGTVCTSQCAPAGSSANTVYVTLTAPALPAGQPLFRTEVHLATVNAGAANAAQAFQNTWAMFALPSNSGPANVQTWDGRCLYYYKNGGCANDVQQVIGFSLCATNATQILTQLPSGSGQCGSFAYLFQYSLAVNGIAVGSAAGTLETGVCPVDSSNMLVGNWSFGTPMYPGTAYPYSLVLNPADSITGMVFPGSTSNVYGNLTSTAGLAGQNTPTPSEKVFGQHYIVALGPTLATSIPGDSYFDPSYGRTYTNAAVFETGTGAGTGSVAGYAVKDTNPGAPFGGFVVRQTSGPTNIAFVTAAPGSPTLSAPANGSTGNPSSVLFSWLPTSGATQYTINLSTSSSFSAGNTSYLVPGGATTLSYTVTGVPGATTFYWKVVAANCLSWLVGTSQSQPWTFATK